MGVSAQTGILLLLTGRLHDVEYQALKIQNAQLELTVRENKVYQKYLDALDAQTLTYNSKDGKQISASFNNLCGLNSLDNSIASNRRYVFRSNDDLLIVPSDVYDSYKEYQGTDPYEYAMAMVAGKGIYEPALNGRDETNFKKAEREFLESKTNTSSQTQLQNLKTSIENLVKNIYSSTAVGKKDTSGAAKEGNIQDILDQLFAGNYSYLDAQFDDDINESTRQTIKDIKAKVEQFKYLLYKSGAKSIYAASTGDDPENFDKSKFEYYLYWAKLIQMEEGLDGCVRAGDYMNGFENDAEALNDMLMYGQVSIEVIEEDKSTGKVSDKVTSVAAESALNHTNKSDVDSSDLNKAKAEYDKALNELKRMDKRYEMQLDSLNTERNAITTQMESIKSMIKDNTERIFGIF